MKLWNLLRELKQDWFLITTHPRIFAIALTLPFDEDCFTSTRFSKIVNAYHVRVNLEPHRRVKKRSHNYEASDCGSATLKGLYSCSMQIRYTTKLVHDVIHGGTVSTSNSV